jgi:AcrR family transcriptional regulator
MNTTTEDHGSEVGLRERKKNQTRTAIHLAAFRLIDDQGLEATTIEQICLEADVSSRTFFNYYPSKAAAAFEIPSEAVDEELLERFREAKGGLVAALCDAIGGNADRGPNHLKVKKLVMRHPELITTMSQMMLEVRGQFVALAEERASSREQAELAVTLVMAALARVMHDETDADVPLAARLRATVDLIASVNSEELQPRRSAE